MSLTNVVDRLGPGELAREPRSLGVIAYFDGHGQATGFGPMSYPRRLDPSEAACWRDGYADGKAEAEAYHARLTSPCGGRFCPYRKVAHPEVTQ